MRARWQITVMYVLFMLLVQGVSQPPRRDDGGHLRAAPLERAAMAEYERAKLILQLEHVTHLDDDDGGDDDLDAKASSRRGGSTRPTRRRRCSRSMRRGPTRRR